MTPSATDTQSREAEAVLALAEGHPCAKHQLFFKLKNESLSRTQACALLRNYDAHATVLRRLLLKSASIMPERAVGFVLENVRTEYGSGDVKDRHQLQLKSLAFAAGISEAEFDSIKIEDGVREYIKTVVSLYLPPESVSSNRRDSQKYYRPAISAGAITATEIMSVEEFRSMQIAFKSFDLADHIWFDHVKWEQEHTSESLALSLYFMENHNAFSSVAFGMKGVLDATVRLYDGFLAAIENAA